MPIHLPEGTLSLCSEWRALFPSQAKQGVSLWPGQEGWNVFLHLMPSEHLSAKHSRLLLIRLLLFCRGLCSVCAVSLNTLRGDSGHMYHF